MKLTKEFQARLMTLKSSGKRTIYQQAMMVLGEMGLNTEISKKARAESRIPNCKKYELPEGYRIVFQSIEGVPGEYLALFIGNHDEVDRFLDNHKGWIFDPVTHSLKELRYATASEERINLVVSPALQVKSYEGLEQAKYKPVFDGITTDQLILAGVPPDKIEFATNLKDPDSIDAMNFLEQLPPRTAELLLAHMTGGNDLREEIERLLEGKREYLPSLSSIQMSAIEKLTDTFIDLKDLPEERKAFESMPLEDWMLFLHPDQQNIVTREFQGPARLRGVSGSGKTVVAIHRARYMARKIMQRGTREHVLFLTFNRSLADLVDSLIGKLCTDLEYSKIQVSTLDKWCQDYVQFRIGNLPNWSSEIMEKVWINSLQEHLEFLKKVNFCSGCSAIPLQLKHDSDVQFLEDEIDFIFGKFVHQETEHYLTCERIGRGRRLGTNQRKAILDLYETFVTKLVQERQYVPRELKRNAFAFLNKREYPERDYIAIIVDEVQDLSDIDFQILKMLASFSRDQLFLVGDGAQKIYARGFSMKNLGINLTGRSYLLKKNYRNTREIMKVASSLASSEGIGKYDDDPEASQTIAIPSIQSGEKPMLMIAQHPQQEWNTIAAEIRYLINRVKLPHHEICCLSRSSWERNGIRQALSGLNIPSVDYKADGIAAYDAVKISNLHNSKGHEFRVVFIAGLFEGAIPLSNAIEDEDIEKEAALLYVAMTRAKELLYLSYPEKDQNGRPLMPSRFLKNMESSLEIIRLVS